MPSPAEWSGVYWECVNVRAEVKRWKLPAHEESSLTTPAVEAGFQEL